MSGFRNDSAHEFETLSDEDLVLLQNTLSDIVSARTTVEHKDALPYSGDDDDGCRASQHGERSDGEDDDARIKAALLESMKTVVREEGRSAGAYEMKF